jgi:hypothetical protein
MLRAVIKKKNKKKKKKKKKPFKNVLEMVGIT